MCPIIAGFLRGRVAVDATAIADYTIIRLSALLSSIWARATTIHNRSARRDDIKVVIP
jgi:hypothetical protein